MIRCTKTSFMLAIIIPSLVIIFSSCSHKDVDGTDLCNRYDPESPCYVPPNVKIIEGPGDVTNDPIVTFRWKCESDDFHMEYGYRLDDAEWSSWTSEKVHTFPGVDEGDHKFYVKSRYSQWTEESIPAERPFAVDAVKGPTLMVKPRYVEINQGSEFNIQVMAEEVTDLMLAHVVITYEVSMLKVVEENIRPGDFLNAKGGEIVFFKDPAVEGKIGINTGVGISDPAGINGSGTLAQLTFRALKKGETALTFEQSSKLRDSKNVNIPINQLVKGIIQIQ